MCRLQWFLRLYIDFWVLILWVWRLFFLCFYFIFCFIFLLGRLLVLYFSLVARAICYLFFLHVVLYVSLANKWWWWWWWYFAIYISREIRTAAAFEWRRPIKQRHSACSVLQYSKQHCASQQVVGEIFYQFPILLPFNLEKYILTSNLFIKHVSLSELNYLGRLNMATHYTQLWKLFY